MYLSVIQHVTFIVTEVIFEHSLFTFTQLCCLTRISCLGSGSAWLSCCSLVCPLDGAILKHLTLLLPHKVCRRGNCGNHLNWKQLVKLESHISGVKLFFILTFPDACQRTHTPACVCVCVSVCQRLFWPLTTSTFLSCVFDSTLSPDRTCRLSIFLFSFQDLPGTVVPSVQLLPLNYESDQHQQEVTGRGLFMIHCIVKLRLLKYIHFSFHLDARARNRMGASENAEEHISSWENQATLRCFFIYLSIFKSNNLFIYYYQKDIFHLCFLKRL